MIRKLIRPIVPESILNLLGRYHYLSASIPNKLVLIYKLIRWSVYEVFNKDIFFQTSKGLSYFSMPHNFSSLVVYVRNYRDPAIQAFIERTLKQGSVFVDAGANIGTYTVPASKLAGEAGKVIAVEAHPFTYKYLVRNITNNNLTNVEAVPLALGSESGSIRMAYTETNAGETHIATTTEQSITVPVRTLDEVLNDRNIQQVDYIKIDVEGFEYPLLQGTKKTLMSSKNIIVQTELNEKHARRYGRSIKDTIEFLQSLGFSAHTINSDGTSKKADTTRLGEDDVLWWREGSF